MHAARHSLFSGALSSSPLLLFYDIYYLVSEACSGFSFAVVLPFSQLCPRRSDRTFCYSAPERRPRESSATAERVPRQLLVP